MLRITPDGIQIESGNTTYFISKEVMEWYNDLKAAGRIVEPIDEETGVFVWVSDEGCHEYYVPAGVTHAKAD